MSVVTNVILCTGICTEEVADDDRDVPCAHVKRMNQRLLELRTEIGCYGQFHRVEQHMSNSKAMECNVYGGAFNHLRTDRLVEIVFAEACDEEIDLFVQEQEEDGFRRLRPGWKEKRKDRLE